MHHTSLPVTQNLCLGRRHHLPHGELFGEKELAHLPVQRLVLNDQQEACRYQGAAMVTYCKEGVNASRLIARYCCLVMDAGGLKQLVLTWLLVAVNWQRHDLLHDPLKRMQQMLRVVCRRLRARRQCASCALTIMPWASAVEGSGWWWGVGDVDANPLAPLCPS